MSAMQYQIFYRSAREAQAEEPFRMFSDTDVLEDAKQIALRLAFRENEVYVLDGETGERVRDF